MIEHQSVSNLIAGYQAPSGYYDEMTLGPQRLRPHWQALIEHLSELGPAELQRRWEQAQRQLRDYGVTYNPQDETGEASRPWELDAVPLLLAESQWSPLEKALQQRARLFRDILQDVYGRQTLLHDRVVPPQVLFDHPAFQPAFHGLHASKSNSLVLYAADVGRSPDGRWWATGDRSLTPTGLGYVLENRIVSSRMLPLAFRRSNVMRLRSFFLTLRETLQQLAPRSQDNPQIALWTRGPQSASYFEDAYLARYLNFTLVESGDLAVRQDRVMLKTLGGLLPVEVALRRVPDQQCDPVELAESSASGVAGLLESARHGNVALVNALGSQLVESPIWLPFLPAICRHLLGEELQLCSVATWWCGQREARQYVLEHLDRLIIRPAFRVHKTLAIRPCDLSRQEREQLVAAIKAQPQRYVGQEQLRRSTAPIWTNRQLQPWHVAMRCFMVAEDEEYRALPGALARASSSPDDLDSFMATGQRSQDVWIISDEPVERISLLAPQGKTLALRRTGTELPSRVADHLFWLGRHVERADGAARLLRTLFFRLASDEEPDETEIPVMLRLLAEQGQVEPALVVDGLKQSLPDIETLLPESVFNELEPRSLRATIVKMIQLASVVRDRLSVDAWRILHQIDDGSRRPALEWGSMDATDVLEILEQLVIEFAAFSGVSSERMTRTLGWRFLELGKRIESAWHVASILRGSVGVQRQHEAGVLNALLETADSVMTYRSRYLADLQAVAVVDLLLTDETNPRSIGFQLEKIHSHVRRLPRSQGQVMRSSEERLALSMLNLVRLADVQELCQLDVNGERLPLRRLLSRLLDQLPRLSNAISGRFLIHAGLPRHFGTLDSRQR